MPPLFIKIEKYKEVIQSIQQLRAYALSLRDALDALALAHLQRLLDEAVGGVVGFTHPQEAVVDGEYEVYLGGALIRAWMPRAANVYSWL